MGTLQQLLLTLGFCVLILLPTSILSDAQLLDNQRFINSEMTIGKTSEEVKKEIGAPNKRGECSVTTYIGRKPRTLAGEGWAYRAVYNNGASSLDICFIQGLAVTEKRTYKLLNENDQEYSVITEVADHFLLRNIIDNRLNRPKQSNPGGPGV